MNPVYPGLSYETSYSYLLEAAVYLPPGTLQSCPYCLPTTKSTGHCTDNGFPLVGRRLTNPKLLI